MAQLLDPMPPGGWLTGVGNGIVPFAYFVDMAAGGKTCPARDADRTIAIGIFEQRSLFRQPIHIRSSNDRIAIGAEHLTAVLVRHDKENIASGHLSLPTDWASNSRQ